jgi:hypothetical protein
VEIDAIRMQKPEGSRSCVVNLEKDGWESQIWSYSGGKRESNREESSNKWMENKRN